MWKKQDDPEGKQPDKVLPSEQRPNLASFGDPLVESPMNDELQNRDVAVASPKGLSEASDQPPFQTMKKYTESVKEFTKNATAFIQHLPLLTKARDAYEEAMRASAEIRTVLDSSDENLRTLITQLEQRINLQELKSDTGKKPPEPAKVEKMKGAEESGSRGFRWP